MKFKFADNNIDYDGSQLRSRWIESSFDLDGDAIVAFRGACDVKPEYMVDLEDLESHAAIFSKDMLHIIVEQADVPLREMVSHQRLLICMIKELMEASAATPRLTRSGDDLYDGGNKVTISIATSSPTSGLIHTGINIDSSGTPVPTKGLKDYGIEPRLFGLKLIENYAEEMTSIEKAARKVKLVK